MPIAEERAGLGLVGGFGFGGERLEECTFNVGVDCVHVVNDGLGVAADNCRAGAGCEREEDAGGCVSHFERFVIFHNRELRYCTVRTNIIATGESTGISSSEHQA